VTPEPERDRAPTVVICSTVLALAVLGLYAWQIATGRDAGSTLVLLVAMLGAAVPGFTAHTKAGQLQRDVTAVKTQTNGNTTRLLDMLERVLAAQQTPPPAPPTPPAEPVWPDATDDPPTSP